MDADVTRRPNESDAELVERVRAGETSSFDELVRRYQVALVRVAASRLGRRDWAEDVVQETFLAAFKSCGTYDPRYNFRTWLWTILLNQCHNHYQRRQRRAAHEPLVQDNESTRDAARASDGQSPLATLLAKERSEQLESLLRELTVVQADALRQRFFGGLKFHEIAETMQCSLNTAKNRVRLGLVRMAELLEAAASRTAGGNLDEEP
jgi:RNA polymerase sigma-70 factor (ECF subfamily)